jgi:hypothetical protein
MADERGLKRLALRDELVEEKSAGRATFLLVHRSLCPALRDYNKFLPDGRCRKESRQKFSFSPAK